MVGNAMQIPSSFFDYLNPQTSKLNPANVNYSFFVYGTFPLILNKIVAILFENDNYNNFTIQGRFLSALADLLVIVLIYKTILLFERRYEISTQIKYWASLFYAIAVLPIQLSHFFAVDTFLNLFMFSAFYFAARFWITNSLINVALSGVFFGCAMASKVSAIYILPLIIFFLAINSFSRKRQGFVNIFFKSALIIILFSTTFYLSLRFLDPYLFQDNNIFNPQISSLFLENLKTLKSYSGEDTWYPPSIQWIHKLPVVFSLFNLSVFGVGLPYFVFIILGVYFIIAKIRRIEIFVIVLWSIIFFFYQSIQFVKVMRYFVFIYPFLAIIAGLGFHYFTKIWGRQFGVLTLLLILIWPLAFFSIYTKNHSRVIASEWIYTYIPYGSAISCEYWDDCLPRELNNKSYSSYKIETLTFYDRDTPDKWAKINNQLLNLDYIILSSNRLWGSISNVPERYPITAKFYRDLFADNLSFKKVAEITSYPSLGYLGIPIDFPDDWADESFTVYDHPKVIIFSKEKNQDI